MNIPPRKPSILPFYYLAISLFGLYLLAVLTFNIPASTIDLTLKRQLTVTIFGVICILGIIAGTSPSKCSRTLHFRKTGKKNPYKTERRKNKPTASSFKGHHPTCGSFSSHVLQFRSRTYCAGCAGLVIGAMVSLLGIFFYSYGGLHVGEARLLVFWSGLVGVAFGLLQYNPFIKRGSVHFSLNVIFVLGAFLLLVGVIELNGNFLLQFYYLVLVVYWIVTRIVLSQFEHKKICESCDLNPCGFSFC